MKALLAKLPFLRWNLHPVLASPFPFFLNDDRRNIGLSFGVSLFVLLFMVVYRPFPQFEINHTPDTAVPYAAIIFMVMVLNLVGLPKLFPATFDPFFWNLGKYILFVLWLCFSIGLVCVIVDKLIVCPQHGWYHIIVNVFTQVALTGVLPITIITLLLRNNLLQQHLQEAIHINKELEKIDDLKQENATAPLSIFTIFSETSETLRLHLPDLLFVEASDNYSTFYWKGAAGVQKKLLRLNLKNLESQLNNTFIVRCHRSYVVNIHAIQQVTGNANGYKLHIRDCAHTIPVARAKGQEVMEKISELRHMMELY